VIRTGIVLPTFRETPADALEAAHEAFAAGVDGVFCYDHLWPLGEPDRPALAPFPVLAALIAPGGIPPTPGGGPYFGTLVARVGLVPNAVLLGQFRALDLLAPGRIIAGLGTGDRLSEAENRAYGIPFGPAAERRAEMVELGAALGALGITVWVAGGPAARVVEARAIGAALNVWEADPILVATRSQGPEAVEVTWGGPAPKGGAGLETMVEELAHAGATWAIFGWPIDPAALAAAARAAGEGVVQAP
jgi:alkanesulfonate monooxygenase SsuD/methylene tetrahydromethanopterin reductase-like flavin-dependent oxidoreductase (luciferase family)